MGKDISRLMNSSRTKNATRNAIAGVINRVVGLILPFILRTAIIRVLGEQYLGLNNLFTSLLQVLSLADLGFNSAIVFSMYKPIAEDDIDKICSLICLYRKIYVFIGCIIGVAGIIIVPFLKYLIKGDCPRNINITILYLIYLSNTVISYLFFAHRKALLSAYQRSDVENNINSMTQLFFDSIKIILLFSLKNYYLYIIFLPITTFVSGFATSIYSYRIFPGLKCKGEIDKDTKTGIFKRVMALSLQKIGNTVSLSLDNIVVSSFIGLTAVAIYSNYFYIVSSLISFISVCISAMNAGIGNSMVTETKEKNYFIFQKINMLNHWTMIWCIPCLLCLYQNFMYMWVGTGLMTGYSFVILMVIYFYVAEIRKVVQVYKDAAGIWQADKWRPLVGCLVNFILNIWLVRYIDINGVILSTIISYLFIEIPWETKAFFKTY